jgi:hypothetical protein
MKRSAPPRAPGPKSLAQQNTDFTAEGSPPPGRVAGTGAAAALPLRHAASRTPAGIPGAHRRAPTGKRR